MAKSQMDPGNGPPVNKSAAIREVLAVDPRATSREVISQLSAKGIKVSTTMVYYVRSKDQKATRKAKRARVAETSRQTGIPNPVELVIRVKNLAREVGGFRHLKQLVDLLAE